MPHINYHRGETRTFVVRKSNWSTRKTYQWHSGKRKKGLLRNKDWTGRSGFGRNGFCPCCTPYPPGSREWKQQTSRYYRRIIDNLAIEEELEHMECAEGKLQLSE